MDFTASPRYHDFVGANHRASQRDYLARVNAFPKAEAASRCKTWGYDYWDGSRDIGYGGYSYDGRWKSVAQALIAHYGLQAGMRVLDVGCGKGFLLHDLARLCPGLEVAGLDISQYALDHAPTEIAAYLQQGHAKTLPFPDKHFDLVVSINTLHNLYCFEFVSALREIVRVSCAHSYIVVETYRNEVEKVNLLYWQVTCEMFCHPSEWLWWFSHCDYQGDYSFIWFE